MILVVALFYTNRSRLRLPPGPRRIPFLGNIQQLPATYQERAFAEWGKRFGEVVYAQFFNTPVIILSRAETAHALLSKRGAKYSGRPRFTYMNEIVGWNNAPPPVDAVALLARDALTSYEPLQRQEIQKLLRDLIRDPGDALAHVKRYTAALMLGIGYGYSPSSLDDAYIRTSEQAIRLVLGGGGPGSASSTSFRSYVLLMNYVRHLPAWMPGMEFKRRGIRARGMRVKRDVVRCGTATPCVATALLEEAMKGGTSVKPTRKNIDGIGDLIPILAGFLLAMILHPEVLQKVQTEIDSVPRDRTALPYLEAVLTEVYRYLTESDEYAGYDMPKGSIVIGNIWAMSRDEDLYPDPDRFDPERFLNICAETAETRDPRNFVFGFGRRICPGRVLADSSIFHAASNLAAVFDIRQASGPDGKPIPVAVVFTSGTVRTVYMHTLPKIEQEGGSHSNGRSHRQSTVMSEHKNDSP
ncbi:cytochrome P450 [Fomitopsis serialis]|uniref:cytochrome P450 n=1 Tax=Fomitopsis serialis TaxID=139415 RepID=UPI0020081394|nr:cytochrome P450 [Neoantrodia serialis]KAH9919731.1 cytochrome P450 [Neoantrodia serialis]